MMKKAFIFFVFAACSLTMCCVFCGAKKSSKATKPCSFEEPSSSVNTKELSVDEEESLNSSCENKVDMMKLSEAFGHLIARSLENPIVDFNLESIIKGMHDCARGLEAPMTEEEFEEIIGVLQNESFQQVAEANLKTADDFMAENATKENVVEVKPGKLQYQVMREGHDNDRVITQNSTPRIHYKGMCLDGTAFGDSEQTGGPIAISLNETIPGFGQGIVGMKLGEKRKLFVHPDLAYGVEGGLPPNSLLIFEVEAVDLPALAENPELAESINEAIR